MNYNLIAETDRETLQLSLDFYSQNFCKSFASPRTLCRSLNLKVDSVDQLAGGNRDSVVGEAFETANSLKPCCCGRCAWIRRLPGAKPPWQRTSRRFQRSSWPLHRRSKKPPRSSRCRPCGCCTTPEKSLSRSRDFDASGGNSSVAVVGKFPEAGRCRWGLQVLLLRQWADQSGPVGWHGDGSVGCRWTVLRPGTQKSCQRTRRRKKRTGRQLPGVLRSLKVKLTNFIILCFF